MQYDSNQTLLGPDTVLVQYDTAYGDQQQSSASTRLEEYPSSERMREKILTTGLVEAGRVLK